MALNQLTMCGPQIFLRSSPLYVHVRVCIPGYHKLMFFIVIEKNTGKPLSGAVAVEPASIVTISEENNVPRIDCHVPSADSDTEDQTGIPRSSKVRGAGGHFLIL